MKSTGIVRKLDELNRLVIPKELCRVMGVDKGDKMEIFVENDTIILRPYYAADEIVNLIMRIEDRLKNDEYPTWVTADGIIALDKLSKIVEGDSHEQ